MSSTASSKQPAENNSADEPTSKKVKISKGDNANITASLNTGDSAKDTISSNADRGIPGKNAANGKAEGASEASRNDQSKTNQSNAASEDLDEDEGQPDPKISGYLEEIGAIQNEIGALNEKASEEILKVEQKFNKLRKPHYEKRNQLLRNIPHFWIQTLYNHPSISPIIDTDDDEECLRYLIDLDVEEFEDIKSGYKIKLRFAENPYFKNDIIVKEFHMISGDEQVASSTPLEYRDTDEGNGLREIVKRELEMYNSMQNQGNIPRSFFAWFLDPVESGTDEIAEIIKDQIWPNPLDYYLSEETTGLNDSDDESDDEELDEEDVLVEADDMGEELDEDIEEEELIEEIGDEEVINDEEGDEENDDED